MEYSDPELNKQVEEQTKYYTELFKKNPELLKEFIDNLPQLGAITEGIKDDLDALVNAADPD